MIIGTVGSGIMARSLGILWAEHGHEVFFGGRNYDIGRSVGELVGHGT